MKFTQVMKKIVAVVLAALMVVGMTPLSQSVETMAAGTNRTIYFKPGVWETGGAWYQAWVWGSSESDHWVTATDSDGDGVYEMVIPSDATSMKLLRKSPDHAANSWISWNETDDITIDSSKNCFSINGWNYGSWSTIAEPNYYVCGSAGLCGVEWDTTNANNKMTKNADGTYTITYSNVAAGSYEFKVTKDGAWTWPANNYLINIDKASKITITYSPSSKQGKVDIEPLSVVETYDRMDEVPLSPEHVFYANVDLVDYLNNSRVEDRAVNGYYTDNQGEWIRYNDAVYSYLNHLISKQVALDNQYTYPLYFGPLHYIEPRYSQDVGGSKTNLGNWNTAANVALAQYDADGELNTSAVAQGLVGKALDAKGNLVDPKTGASLLYFDREAAETWTNKGYNVMAYYPDLQFPFVMNYDSDSRVTTYSYDSASDYAVYYDYTNNQLYASNTHVQDEKDNDGFYPFNEPDDADNEVNNGFGAKFTIDFTVGDDGILANGEPVTFEFTGDDDVWVFIDGKLVLDMGGAHAKAHGKIDFSTLTATVDNAVNVADSYTITSKSTYDLATYDNQGLDNWIYYDMEGNSMDRATMVASDKSVTFADCGISDFDYNSVHTMTVFYMERGMIESNFSMEFTMVPVPSGLTLSKNLNEKDINAGVLGAVSAAKDFNFDLSATSPSNTSVAFSKYTLTEKYTGETSIMKANGKTSGKTYTATIDGITNYAYAHSFVTDSGEDAFIPGTTFSIEESTNGIFSYSGTSWAIYDAKNGYENITSSVKTSSSNTSGKTAAFTMGKASDTTAYSYAVSFTNIMEVGSLQVSKIFSDSLFGDTVFNFNVYLDLDGAKSNYKESLYPGLVYTVDGKPITSEDGTISITGGQTAVISGIPAGATYRIEEVVPSNANWMLTDSENTTGTITSGGTAAASFTNEMKLGTLQVSKIFEDSVLGDTAFQFKVYLDMDGKGSKYQEELQPELVYTVGGRKYTSSDGIISIAAGQTAVISDLPAGATYRVEEVVPSDANWVLSASRNATGTITSGGTAAASFTNEMKVGTLQVSKIINSSELNNTVFQFKVYLDMDGAGSNYSEKLQTGLVCTVNGKRFTASDGIINITGGQTAVIADIPAGATYRVEEIVPSGAAWEMTASENTTGNITADGTVTAFFTNTAKIVNDKAIYVEAGTPTGYTVKYNGKDVKNLTLTPETGLTAEANDAVVTVTGEDPDKAYKLGYQGRLADGTFVSGTITVYTFAATDKVYVFDFGLASNLADTTYGDGLFQGGYFYNSIASGEKAVLTAVTGKDNTQTTITFTKNGAIQSNGTAADVIFKPVAFMSRIEEYSYTVQITAAGKTFKAGDPETGCTVIGSIKVMPANTVYYEDNFNVTDRDNNPTQEFIFSSGAVPNSSEPTMLQSNDQDSNYGYDDCYLSNYRDSNGASAVLGNGKYAYFTFSGTGFDLISRTTATTAGIVVYVFEGGHNQKYINYMNDLTNTSVTPKEMVFVNTYYNNGDLYQVPVVSVRLDANQTYTAYVQCLATSYGSSVVFDGVRIYNPLVDTSAYPLVSERSTKVDELRVLYKNSVVSLAGKANSTLFTGLGKQSIVQQAIGIVEDMDNAVYTTASELEDIYKHGPNNEMYLPKNFGIKFSYTVDSSDWTMQVGAKAVTKSDAAKSFSVYVRVKGSSVYEKVADITLSTTTDMYYDLTALLADYDNVGYSYDLFIISNSAESNNEFVSLTTVKHSGITLS